MGTSQADWLGGLGAGLGGLARLSSARTRSLSAENPTGEKGRGATASQGTGAHAARELGPGWKISPSIVIEAGQSATLADIDGPGVIQHIWCTVPRQHWRALILRISWDAAKRAAIQVPIGDFFCQGWCEFSQVSSLPIAVNAHGGFNSYWPMPFRRKAQITLDNIGGEPAVLYYQLTYSMLDVPDDVGYLHAQWRRSNPVPSGDVHLILEGATGPGHYVGTYMAWGANNSGWWGEGELKFYLDGDQEFPTICGTGIEDYFGGAFGFDIPGSGYATYTTPFLGLNQVIRPDGFHRSQQRFGMYRWHVLDPIRFDTDLKVTAQALGWRSRGRYLLLQDDIASTALWYQRSPDPPSHPVMDADALEVI
jgi:hypothetical protein